jgi:hypothetical protein
MNIDYEMALDEVYSIPQQDNMVDVVAKVQWTVSFFDTDHPNVKSSGVVTTHLYTDSINVDSFVAYEDVTQTQILQWALDAQGGTSFLDQLLEGGHADNVAALVKDLDYVRKDTDLIPQV